jgi:hypothetical protein
MLLMRPANYKLLFLFLAFAFAFSSSCKRNKDSDVVITVVDGTSGAPVAGATVHLYIPPNTSGNLQQQDQTGVTDGAGTVSFTFKLPAILQADVTPPAPYAPASALVKLEEGKQVSKTIKVY